MSIKSYENIIHKDLIDPLKEECKKIHHYSTKTIGPIRSDLLKESIDKKKLNFKYTILVMDSHSRDNYYKNGLSWFSNWRENFIFYENISLLAKKNPNYKFIIKGKNYKFLEIEYFNKINKIMREIANVEFFTNSPNNSFYELIDKAKSKS